MPRSDSRPTPPTDIWPPPPQGRGGEAGSVVINLVEVMQTPDRLTLRNRQAKYGLIFGCCGVCLIALLPLLLSLIFPYRLGRPPTAWDYVAFVYLHISGDFVYIGPMGCVLLGGQIWFLYERHLHRGHFALDRRGGTVQAGGGIFCLLGELEYVLIRRAAGRSNIYLMRVDKGASPAWVAHGWPRVPRNACLVARFRYEASAEDVAGIIAKFAGVTVRQ